MNDICRLCLEKKELQKSHIIPRGFFKKLKKSSPQLFVVTQDHKITLNNSDPKDNLLCFDCEQFINTKYESYGIRLLRNHQNIRKNSDHIVISNFNYKKFYLFLLSIFWRASLSKDIFFSTVNGIKELDDLMRYCIKDERIRINRLSNLKIDNFIRVCVFRLTDSTNNISDAKIKSVLSTFSFIEMKKTNSFAWYFIVEGFVIFYIFSSGKNIHEVISLRLKSQLRSGSHQKICKIDIPNDSHFRDVFNNLIISTQDKSDV